MHRIQGGSAALLVMVSLGAAADVVQVKERTYLVKYKDGATERYNVRWTGHFDATVRDVGGSPIPYQGSTENRRCAWSIDPKVERAVSLVTRLGQPFPMAGMGRTFDREPQGAAFLVKGERNESCAQTRRERDEEIARTRTAFLASFERLASADMEALKGEVQANAEVASVTPQ